MTHNVHDPENPPHDRRRHYSDADRERALAIYATEGLAAAARAIGCAKTTVRNWAVDAGLDPTELASAHTARTEAAARARDARCALLRAELRELWLLTAVKLLERIDEPHIDFRGRDADEVTFPHAPANAARDYVIAAATALDKYRLEVGEATDRREDVSLEQRRQWLAQVRNDLGRRRSA